MALALNVHRWRPFESVFVLWQSCSCHVTPPVFSNSLPCRLILHLDNMTPEHSHGFPVSKTVSFNWTWMTRHGIRDFLWNSPVTFQLLLMTHIHWSSYHVIVKRKNIYQEKETKTKAGDRWAGSLKKSKPGNKEAITPVIGLLLLDLVAAAAATTTKREKRH